MKQDKEQPTNEGTEQLANVIAGNIVKTQRRLAAVLNKRINRMSKPHQICLLVISCTIIAVALISSLLWPDGKLAMNSSSKNYLPTHIGMASEMPQKTKPTDSLTIKK
jgi:hypothetical protein